MRLVDLLHGHGRTILFGFALALLSSLGQTFFVGLFAPDIRAAFDLTHGGFGTVYSGASLTAGIAMIWVGSAIDRHAVPDYAAAALLLVAASALMLSAAPAVALLALALFGLRLGGQGMLTHAAIVSAARLPAGARGRAMGLASLGLPAGEATLPALVVAGLGFMAWTSLWLIAALAPLAMLAGVLGRRLLVSRARRRSGPATARAGAAVPAAGETGPRRRRVEILADWRFLVFLPAMIGTPAVATGYMFFQREIAAENGWPLDVLALSFTVYALCGVLTGFVAGVLVDRLSAVRLAPLFLLPLVVASLLLAAGPAPLLAPVFFAVAALTVASSNVVITGVLAELFGTAQLGMIRAMFMTLVVLASATTPILFGLLIDSGVTLAALGTGAAVYLAAASAAALPLWRVLPGRIPG